jgi:hypothetical protein
MRKFRRSNRLPVSWREVLKESETDILGEESKPKMIRFDNSLTFTLGRQAVFAVTLSV